MIFIINKHCERLCNDGKFRGMANIGFGKECVKVFVDINSACKECKGTIIVDVPKSHKVAEDGTITETNPKHHLQEFIVANSLSAKDRITFCEMIEKK